MYSTQKGIYQKEKGGKDEIKGRMNGRIYSIRLTLSFQYTNNNIVCKERDGTKVICMHTYIDTLKMLTSVV